MKLADTHPDDLIEANRWWCDGMVGRVVEIRDGVVQFEPLCRGISYRHATAREIITHWRKTGAGDRDPPIEATCPSAPLCRANGCRCASRREHFGRAHAGTEDHRATASDGRRGEPSLSAHRC